MTTPSMKAAELFVKALEHEGIEYIFGIPGEENLDFLEALSHSSIKLILVRHEQAAGFMAATIGHLTGKVGVCLSTLGPGATNFVTAAAYAQLGAMPMLMITGQKPIKMSKQGHFQIVDVVDMMRPLTKYTRQIVNGANIPARVREAIRIAEQERPGAVHIELPEDIAAEMVEAPLFDIHSTRRPAAEAKAIKIAVSVIENATSPLILIGAGATRQATSPMLTKLIKKTGIPFFNTQLGKGVVDENHPLYVGTAALSDNDFVHAAIRKADLIINIGHDVVEKPPFFMRHGGFDVIHINFLPAEVDPVYFPQYEVIGDIANALWQIADVISVQKHWDFSYFLKIKQAMEAHVCEDSDSASFPVLPQRLVADVRKAMPADGIVALDNGMYKIWFARAYKCAFPNTLLLDNALATMGAGLPSAMVAKMLNPDKKVICVTGDGGFMMNSQEIETAIRLNLDLVIIILNDNGYGMIKWKQSAMGMENFGLEYNNPDFIKYAESFGARGYRVEKTEDLRPLLQRCLDSKGVHVIDVPIDYSHNVRVLVTELKERTRDL